ncbi:ABC transporter permease [Nesterenkonia pannonica]|uniref:ABC transporter permease n=1 Tax=Nesterenkonia pannonica TaxID=1548602 RepID=UPI0021645367|nr:ABC transporter permease [Nesterenkonia pannonica]
MTGREDFGLPQGTALISAQQGSETWAALDPATDGTALIVRLQDGLSMGQIANLAGQLESEEVIFDGALSHASMVGFVDILLGIVLRLLGAAIVVAVIGVSNTLSLSVLERRREGRCSGRWGCPAGPWREPSAWRRF